MRVIKRKSCRFLGFYARHKKKSITGFLGETPAI